MLEKTHRLRGRGRASCVYFDGQILDNIEYGIGTDTTVASTFEITGPNVDTEDATYVKVEVRPSVDSEWETPERILPSDAFLWEPSRRSRFRSFRAARMTTAP